MCSCLLSTGKISKKPESNVPPIFNLVQNTEPKTTIGCCSKKAESINHIKRDEFTRRLDLHPCEIVCGKKLIQFFCLIIFTYI